MTIAFVTTQTLQGSTVIGRVLPLAKELAKNHEVTILGHGDGPENWHNSGQDPFRRTPAGKKRLSGLALVWRLKLNAFIAALKLIQLKPDVIIIVKSLPENVFAVRLATLFYNPKKTILDVDDFELTANALSSIWQRAAVHWAERAGARLADQIVTASPFLSDHFEQLTRGKKPITMIPTGL